MVRCVHENLNVIDIFCQFVLDFRFIMYVLSKYLCFINVSCNDFGIIVLYYTVQCSCLVHDIQTLFCIKIRLRGPIVHDFFK